VWRDVQAHEVESDGVAAEARLAVRIDDGHERHADVEAFAPMRSPHVGSRPDDRLGIGGGDEHVLDRRAGQIRPDRVGLAQRESGASRARLIAVVVVGAEDDARRRA
jgi:hypothetical protein